MESADLSPIKSDWVRIKSVYPSRELEVGGFRNRVGLSNTKGAYLRHAKWDKTARPRKLYLQFEGHTLDT